VDALHASRQLCDVSVLALLKTVVNAYPGAPAGLREEPYDRAASPGHAGHHHGARARLITTARERVINHALGTTWPSYAAI